MLVGWKVSGNWLWCACMDAFEGRPGVRLALIEEGVRVGMSRARD